MKRLRLNIQLFAASVSLSATETGTSIENNTSEISLNINVSTSGDTWNGQKGAYYQVTTTSQNNGTQTGSKVYFSINKNSSKSFNVSLGPFTHNADGSLNDVSISVYVRITSSTSTTKTTSRSMATIPRASQPTLNTSSVTLGSTSLTITTNRVSTSFTHTINTKINGTTIQSFTSIATSHTFTPSIANYAPYITNSSSGTCTIECITYNGSSQVGTKTVTATFIVPSSVKPSVSITSMTEGNASLSGFGIWVQNASKINVQLSTTPAYGSSVTTSSSINGEIKSGTSFTTSTLTTSGTNTLSVTATDKRNAIQTASQTFEVKPYSIPILQTYDVYRVNASDVRDDEGNYVHYTFKASIYSLKNGSTEKNTTHNFIIKYRIKGSSSSYTTMYSSTGTLSGNLYSVNVSTRFTTSLPNTNEYEIVFVTQDTVSGTISSTMYVDSANDLINFNPSGKSMAFGKISTRGASEECLDIALNTYFENTINGNCTSANTATKATQDGSGNNIVNTYQTKITTQSLTNIFSNYSGDINVVSSNMAIYGKVVFYNVRVRILENITAGSTIGVIKFSTSYKPKFDTTASGKAGGSQINCLVDSTNCRITLTNVSGSTIASDLYPIISGVWIME